MFCCCCVLDSNENLTNESKNSQWKNRFRGQWNGRALNEIVGLLIWEWWSEWSSSSSGFCGLEIEFIDFIEVEIDEKLLKEKEILKKVSRLWESETREEWERQSFKLYRDLEAGDSAQAFALKRNWNWSSWFVLNRSWNCSDLKALKHWITDKKWISTISTTFCHSKLQNSTLFDY